MGYVLEPKGKVLEKAFPSAVVAKEQCNLEDPSIIERVVVLKTEWIRTEMQKNVREKK